MNVSAIIVTRGGVNLDPCFDTMPEHWERIVWDNSAETDLSVYGRYAAIEAYASHDLCFVQDDDVIVSDPQAIVDGDYGITRGGEVLVANMPQEFRPHYPDSCLVGFGSCFHRDAPSRAFARFEEEAGEAYIEKSPFFHRTCDVVFTTLTTRVLVDVPVTHREFASDSDRMWKQPGHVEERVRMLELARKVRDA